MHNTMIYCDNGDQATNVTTILSDMGWMYGYIIFVPVSVLSTLFKQYYMDRVVYLLLNPGNKRIEGVSPTPFTNADTTEGIPVYPASVITESYNDN